MNYPKISLALDTVSLIKRWITPQEWMGAIEKIGGIYCIEASTDNEIDPFLTTKSYIKDWISNVARLQAEHGFKVVSFYSGYVTYRSCGLTHPDKRIRRKLLNGWFKPVVDIASELNAEVGCNLNAFSEHMLSNETEYARAVQRLEESLCIAADYAADKHVRFSYEQMYTPTQGNWTIEECRKRMRRIYSMANAPMYITLDAGHAIGQKEFFKTEQSEMSKDYLSAGQKDADVYEWLRELGRYSPIIHLQQTDGRTSSHRPFTQKWNETGIIHPKKVLAALKESFEREQDITLPGPAEEIHLVFEPFFSITEPAEDIIAQIRETVAYWRIAVPRDGIRLDEIDLGGK